MLCFSHKYAYAHASHIIPQFQCDQGWWINVYPQTWPVAQRKLVTAGPWAPSQTCNKADCSVGDFTSMIDAVSTVPCHREPASENIQGHTFAEMSVLEPGQLHTFRVMGYYQRRTVHSIRDYVQNEDVHFRLWTFCALWAGTTTPECPNGPGWQPVYISSSLSFNNVPAARLQFAHMYKFSLTGFDVMDFNSYTGTGLHISNVDGPSTGYSEYRCTPNKTARSLALVPGEVCADRCKCLQIAHIPEECHEECGYTTTVTNPTTTPTVAP